jgi:hypothetical protein
MGKYMFLDLFATFGHENSFYVFYAISYYHRGGIVTDFLSVFKNPHWF